MPHPLFQVDAFTEQPFAGNPAAVCLLDGPEARAWMQSVAREMNLSETAFLYPESDEEYRLRWFTPTTEVELCGHATLASAHILWEESRLAPRAEARFQTRSGLLACAQSDGWIEMDFPALPVEAVSAPPALGKALGISPRWVGKSRLHYLVEVPSEEIVRAIEPDFARLATLDAGGVIVTSRSRGEEFDFVSRYFAPGHGINEDPVTGSAHCALGPFWGAHLDKDVLTGYQASARGGTVRVRLLGDRLRIGGKAVTVMRGELT